MPCDYDSILFSSYIIKDIYPTEIVGYDKRIQAKREKSRAISLGLK
jgi:hypothetical protein